VQYFLQGRYMLRGAYMENCPPESGGAEVSWGLWFIPEAANDEEIFDDDPTSP